VLVGAEVQLGRFVLQDNEGGGCSDCLETEDFSVEGVCGREIGAVYLEDQLLPGRDVEKRRGHCQRVDGRMSSFVRLPKFKGIGFRTDGKPSNFSMP
jgi:hypothetical protein